MALITAIQRQTLIAKDQTDMLNVWSRISSDITRETDRLLNMAAWKNNMFVNGGGDFDTEDMLTIKLQYDKIMSELQDNMLKLVEAGQLPNDDISIYKVNNDEFIAKYSIDTSEFDKRYQV